MKRIKLQPVDTIPSWGGKKNVWTPILQEFIEGTNEKVKVAGAERKNVQGIRAAACRGNFNVRVISRGEEVFLTRQT